MSSHKRINRIAGQFDAREIILLESPAFRAASLSCRMIMDRLAIELAHHGGNDNGKLPVTYDQFVEYGLHRHAISPAIREGEALGLFFVTERGRANAGEFRAPNLFRISYRAAGKNPPTNEWKAIKTDDEAKLKARAARFSPSQKTKSQCRFPPNTGDGFRHRNGKFPVPVSVTTGTSTDSITTSISRAGGEHASVTRPMTPAERQKRYRERQKARPAGEERPVSTAKTGAERQRDYRARKRAAMNGHAT
jgi:hypothetical protein